ncbi:hypothetical protein [Hymenobacter yonginensis]|uniref:Uncharacterized protein n=1 Tax=Hymenobacter yonginensis TaxID=748197 RepID=A0ABY7PVC2_9BACT|nr:hypothetical protein [Hymenobacter yonginensis]WBO86851.1 hypothetical protein O9Z63_20425 [Hymenobacter yonginensis]
MNKTEALEVIRLSSKRRGVFHPFSYAIGLDGEFDEFEDALQRYPIAQPYTHESIEMLGKSMSFIHEYAHLMQYLSTSFGLRCIRSTIITLNRLSKSKRTSIPVINNNFASETSNYEDLSRYLFYLECIDQLSIHKKTTHSITHNELPILWLELWNPFHNTVISEDNINRISLYLNNNITSKYLPHLLYYEKGRVVDVIVTAAILMEAFAVLAEANNIGNAFNQEVDLLFILGIVPEEAEYTSLIAYAAKIGMLKFNSIIPLMICIDIALMYDPFILFNINTLVNNNTDGIADEYPGMIFFNACNEALDCSFESFNDVKQFYSNICDKMKIPPPEQMAFMAHERAENIYKTTSDETLMGYAFRMHVALLKARRDDPYHFFSKIIRSDSIWDLLDLIYKDATFYSIADKKPLGEFFFKLDTLTAHAIIKQLLLNKRLDCPLKYGIPLRCPNAGQKWSTVCSWKHNNKEYDCFVLVVENILGIIYK